MFLDSSRPPSLSMKGYLNDRKVIQRLWLVELKWKLKWRLKIKPCNLKLIAEGTVKAASGQSWTLIQALCLRVHQVISISTDAVHWYYMTFSSGVRSQYLLGKQGAHKHSVNWWQTDNNTIFRSFCTTRTEQKAAEDKRAELKKLGYSKCVSWDFTHFLSTLVFHCY